jgi:RIO-like serine/threonine protein kinase
MQDAGLPQTLLREVYLDLIHILWRLYRVCKLVHGDLSEYNLLYHERQVIVIDVSQSVDLDHPKALDFLREDCKHVNDFFRKAGMPTLTLRELFDFITDPLVTEGNRDAVLNVLQQVHFLQNKFHFIQNKLHFPCLLRAVLLCIAAYMNKPMFLNNCGPVVIHAHGRGWECK